MKQFHIICCSQEANRCPRTASEKVTRQSQTQILIFYNQAPVMWLSKKNNLVKTSTFRSNFTALKLAVGLVIALQYKMLMFGVPREGPTDMFCDNDTVFENTSIPESVFGKKNHRIAYHKCREVVAALICRISKEDNETNLEYLFTKILGHNKEGWLLNLFKY